MTTTHNDRRFDVYEQAVERATAAVRRADEALWRLAVLTYPTSAPCDNPSDLIEDPEFLRHLSYTEGATRMVIAVEDSENRRGVQHTPLGLNPN